MTLKQQIFARYAALIEEKISLRKQQLQELIDSTANETKSAAGDKYETGRAMLQIEQDNIRRQLLEIQEQKAAFERINADSHSGIVRLGSLVLTDRGYYLLSVALGKITEENNTIIALSPQSPLGSQLLGKSSGDTISLNGVKTIIQTVD